MDIQHYNIIFLLIFLCNFIHNSLSGLNNLHMYDGVSIHDVTSGDIFFEIIEPRELEYTYRLRPAKDFGAPFNSSISLQKSHLIPVEPPYACEVPANQELSGKVALVERGECSFVEKALNAEKAGAVAVIITDTKSVDTDLLLYREFYIEMVDDNTNRNVNIPAGFLIGHSGRMIRKVLKRLNLNRAIINLPVNVTYRTVKSLKEPPWIGF